VIIQDVTRGGALGVKDKGGSATTDGSYVIDAQTEADRRVEAMAIRAFREFCPTLALVAEESFEGAMGSDEGDASEILGGVSMDGDDNVNDDDFDDSSWAPRLQRPIDASRVAVYFDPLDGTNEYAAGEREAITILCGVAVDGVPVAGVIGQPFYKYGRADAQGALGRVVWGGTGIGVHGLDIAKDAVAPPLPPAGPHVVAVNRNIRENRQEPVLEALRSRVDVRISATGFHYLLLLERRAHSALMLRKASKKWDTCAGEALLRAMGGVVTDTVGRRYNYAYNLNALPNLSGMTASLDVDMHCEMTNIIRDVIRPLGRYPYDVDDPSIKVGILQGVQTPKRGWRAVTVDVGGTLIEPRERVADVYARVAASVGASHVTPASASTHFKAGFSRFRGADGEDAMRYYGDGKSFWRKVIAHVLTDGATRDDISQDTVERVLDALYDYYERPSSWTVAHGALDAFDRLRARGVKVAVASNWDARLPALLDALGIRARVDAVVVSAIEGVEKPSPKFFQAVCDAVSVDACAALHVGDDIDNDFKGATNASFAAAVLWSSQVPSGDEGDGSYRAAHDFHALADAVLAANHDLPANTNDDTAQLKKSLFF